jgi:CTD small phosphatase-like protein 2
MASSTPKGTTPVRNNSNYAAPHTPIASVKRPRSSLERPPSAKQTPASAAMSPMHPPRPAVDPHKEEPVSSPESSSSWVGRQVDALFSPVLSFLGTNAEEEEEVHAVTDEDVAMAEEEKEELKVKESSSASAFDEEEEELHHDMGDLEETPSSSFDEEEFNPYLFIKSLPSYDLVCGSPRTCLPEKSSDKPITLVLDLDETLVHCTVDPTPDADLIFPVFFHGMEYQVHVRLRPYLYEFLERIHDQYEVVVFTASQKVYADELLNRIDPSM